MHERMLASAEGVRIVEYNSLGKMQVHFMRINAETNSLDFFDNGLQRFSPRRSIPLHGARLFVGNTCPSHAMTLWFVCPIRYRWISITIVPLLAVESQDIAKELSRFLQKDRSSTADENADSADSAESGADSAESGAESGQPRCSFAWLCGNSTTKVQRC